MKQTLSASYYDKNYVHVMTFKAVGLCVHALLMHHCSPFLSEALLALGGLHRSLEYFSNQ